jgi:hypothetical protein
MIIMGADISCAIRALATFCEAFWKRSDRCAIVPRFSTRGPPQSGLDATEHTDKGECT